MFVAILAKTYLIETVCRNLKKTGLKRNFIATKKKHRDKFGKNNKASKSSDF